MIAWLIRFAVQRRVVVLSLATVLCGIGLLQISQTGLDIFPEFSPRQVIIQTEAKGYSAEQVETLVTQPLENTLSGLIGVTRIRSESIQGLSVITVIFEENSNVFRIRQLVAERLASSSTLLPPGTGPATPVPLSSSSATILTIGITSAEHNLMELRTLVDTTLVPRLLSVRGIADVNVFGGEQQQLQIQLDPEKLLQYGLGINDVLQALQQLNLNLGSGFIETSNQQLTLQLHASPLTADKLRQIPLRPAGNLPVTGVLTVGDIASVRHAAAPAIGAAAVNGQTGIVMMLIGQYQANTLEVSRAAEKVLEDFQQLLERQNIQLHPRLFRPSDYIITSVKNLGGHLVVGGFFVLLILMLFLFNLRTAIISALAIPLSLITAIMVLLALDINLNIMVLGGLAIALGEVVDDAIIDTENIFRRLREHFQRQDGRSIARVVIDAATEVRSSVVYASFIVALVFVPLLTLGGVAGRLFSPLGFAYILAILMSLLVAITITPALCYVLLPGRVSRHQSDPPLIQWMKPLYARSLQLMSRIPAWLLVLAIIAGTVASISAIRLGGQFLPELREGHYIIHTTSLPGTSLEESLRMGSHLTEAIRKIDGVVSMSQWAGRAERGADTYGSHYSEYEVRLEPADGATQQRILDEIRDVLAGFPGILFEANTFLTERVDETISGYTAPVVINIFGHNLDELDRKAREIAAVTRNIPGAEGVQIRSSTGTAQIDIHLHYDQLAFWGLQPADIQLALQTAYEGTIVGSSVEPKSLMDISVILSPERRNDPAYLEQLPISTPQGNLVRLGDISQIRFSEGRYNILHHDGQRLQTVTTQVEDRDLDSFMQELRRQILDQITFPADMFPEFTGAAIEQASAKQELLIHALLAGTGVMLLVYMALGNLHNTWLTLVNIPFSLIGGVIAISLSGASLSVGSMVGFVTLFGITVRNSIMLIAHYNHLIHREGADWNMATMIRGAQERLPSILMTALVTALAMLPIAIDSDNPGREIMGPMASIIIGGLVSSTLLNLILLPLLLLRYGRFPPPAED